MVVDHDGTGLYSTGWNHGDALHCGDLLPDRDGLEVFQPHEWGQWGATMRDAGTGEQIWGVESDDDVGRGVAANLDPNHRGTEAWASSGIGFREGPSGDWLAEAPGSMNHLVWWTGDLQREMLDGWGDDVGVIRKWDPDDQWGDELTRFPETRTNNGTNGNPCLTGDILGDWREEAIFRRADDQALGLCVTPHETDHRIPTLMHDPMYRTGVAWQNVGYNQPPHQSFYIGAEMDDPPTPNVQPVGEAAEPAEPPALSPVQLNGTYRFVNENSGQALSIANGSTDDAASVVQRPYDGAADQHWTVEHLGDGIHRVENVASGSSLDVLEAGLGNRADVIQYPWNGGDNQQWTAEAVDEEDDLPAVGDNENAPTDPDGDGLYEDVNGNGDREVADAVDLFQHRESDAVGSNVDAYDFSGNDEVDLADVVALFQENTG